MGDRRIDDPETWATLRRMMADMMAAFSEWGAESGSPLDLTLTIAEADRAFAAMRDADLSPGQAAVMTMLSFIKQIHASPGAFLVLRRIDPLGPSLFAAAVQMEVLDAQSR